MPEIDPNKKRALKSFRVIGFCTFAALAGALFGFDIGVISACFTMEDFQRRFGIILPDGTPYLSTQRQSLITSLLSAGTFFGSLIQAYTTDLRWGRRGAIFGWAVIFTIGCVIETASTHSITQFVIARFIAGLGVGALSALVPLYNGETAPKDLRGPLVVLYQIMITIGLFLAYGIDLGTYQYAGSASWRIPVGFQLFFGLVIMCGIWFLPESPRLLLGRGQEDRARATIARMNNSSVDDPVVGETIAELEEMIALENEGGRASWLELFSTNHMMWKRTLNACMIQFVQQLNGQNFMYYYGPTFFAQSHTGLNSYEIQLLLGGVTFVGTIPALWLIERLGRRKMLFIGTAGEVTCAIIAGLCGHFMLAPTGTPDNQLTTYNIRGGQLLVAFAILQILFFAMFWGPTPWVISSESFPLRIRSKGIAAATATNWFWNFLVGYFSSKIANDIGPLILLIFAGVLVFGSIYIYFMLPETRGLSLEEIDELYTAKVKPWKSGSWVPPTRMQEGITDGDKVDEKGNVIHREHRKRKAPVMFGH